MNAARMMTIALPMYLSIGIATVCIYNANCARNNSYYLQVDTNSGPFVACVFLWPFIWIIFFSGVFTRKIIRIINSKNKE
jgi:hypothetical protein